LLWRASSSFDPLLLPARNISGKAFDFAIKVFQQLNQLPPG
jgi:hypothetical protein